MEGTPDFDWEKISWVPPEREASSPTVLVKKDSPAGLKAGSSCVNSTAEEVLVNQSLAIDDVERTAKDTAISLEATEDVLVNPLDNHGTETASPAGVVPNMQGEELNQKDDTRETWLEANVEEDVEAEKQSLVANIETEELNQKDDSQETCNANEDVETERLSLVSYIETEELNQKDNTQETCLEANVEEDVETEKLSLVTNIEMKELNQGDTQATCLEGIVEGDLENEKLSQPQAPVDITSPSTGTKMKFQVVHNNGRMTLRVTGNDQPSPQGRKSLVATPTTPKTRSKQRRSSDTGTPQRTKTTDKSIGGKTRNKVMSPRSSTIDSQSSISSPNKPLMDLRHILKKYEKKKEPVPQQQVCEVGFYGSLSAIPFLTMSNDKASAKTMTEKGVRKDNGSRDSNARNQQTKAGTDPLNVPEEETIPQKPRLPTREEIVITAEYDEEQLKLWKSMNALDSSLGHIHRPQEMLPLRPGVRSEKRITSPRNSAVRAFSRPEDWLGHPEWNASQKSYRSISSDQQPDDDVLFMEPDN